MQPSSGSAVPLCSFCLENLGKYGGPATLPCGHNYCLQCIASSASQKADPECPLCRAPFSQNLQLHVNTELRDLVKFATSLHTVEQDGWETVTASKVSLCRNSHAYIRADLAQVPILRMNAVLQQFQPNSNLNVEL